MSLRIPSRALAARCLFCQPLPIRTRIASTLPQRRHASSDDTPSKPTQANPILEEYRRSNPESTDTAGAASLQQRPTAGDISASSIFEDERRMAEQLDTNERMERGEDPEKKAMPKDPEAMARVLDPNPASRERWERKKVIQLVKKGGRISDKQLLKRTEREHLSKSHNMKTSTKKLGMVARQIAGMKLDEAITQMRFSKKKVAIEVLEQLEAARDEAVVVRGMGLGLPANPAEEASMEEQKPIEIQLKSGRRHTVTSATDIYIDQAWVGRGPYGKLPDFRARGRVFIMHTPWTSLSVLLKEEKTRVREWNERETKRKDTRKTWVPLPDRPVQWQRQWYHF